MAAITRKSGGAVAIFESKAITSSFIPSPK